jgi:CRISPR-associated protein Cas5d
MPKFPVGVRPVAVKVSGDRAAFNRPEFASERMSYPCMTPSAARGILEAIYWKPEFHWRVRTISVLRPVQWHTELLNEVSFRGGRDPAKPVIADRTTRVQRHTTVLWNVAYVIVAETVPNNFLLEEMHKHSDIFEGRVRTGQRYRTPYLGCSDHLAMIDPVDPETDRPFPITCTLGRMTFDQNYVRTGLTAENRNDVNPIPVFFEASLQGGVLTVPDDLYEVCGGCRADRTQPPVPYAE